MTCSLDKWIDLNVQIHFHEMFSSKANKIMMIINEDFQYLDGSCGYGKTII